MHLVHWPLYPVGPQEVGKKLGFYGWFFSMVLVFLLGQVFPLTTLQYQMPPWETSRTRREWSATVLGERANT